MLMDPSDCNEILKSLKDYNGPNRRIKVKLKRFLDEQKKTNSNIWKGRNWKINNNFQSQRSIIRSGIQCNASWVRPKKRSTNTLRKGKPIPTVMDTVRSGSNDLNNLIHE